MFKKRAVLAFLPFFVVQISLSMAVTNKFGPYTGQISSYNAAGVVPYAKDANGKIFVLLGYAHAGASNGYWAQFGGRRENQDNNNPLFTAAREGAEELAFIFDTDQDLETLLHRNKKYGSTFKVSKSGSTTYQIFLNTQGMYERTARYYPLFFPRISYDAALSQKFQQRIALYGTRLPHCWNETKRIAWVPLDDLIAAIDSAYKNHPQSGQHSVYVMVNGHNLHIYEGLAKKFKNPVVRQALKNI